MRNRLPGELDPEYESKGVGPSKEVKGIYRQSNLHYWFGSSYASFLVLPRVMMQEMSLEWQNKMTELLDEYDDMFPNQPDIGTRVQATKDGKLTKWPKYFLNYRRPDYKALEKMKRFE